MAALFTVKKRLWGLFFPLMVGMALFSLTSGGEARAACGASISSCKSCHEVRGEMPVAGNGEWHINHSFGDFCEFCHGGVVSSMNKEEAHQGLKDPLADVRGSCGGCHMNDLAERAQVYGAALTDGGSGGGDSPGGGSGATVARPEMVPAEEVPEKDLIDYNRMLLEYQGQEVNLGNYLLVVLNILALLFLLYLIWKYDLRAVVLSSMEVAPAGGEGKSFAFNGRKLSFAELDVIDSILEHPEGAKLLSRLADAPPGDSKEV